jgi:hypothetical protein
MFEDVAGDEVPRTKILEIFSQKTFHNYAPMLYEHNLATPVFGDPHDRRKVTKLKLTQKGKLVRGGTDSQREEAANRTTGRLVTLQEVTELTDAFNRQNPSWRWRLVRNEEVD